MARPTKDGIMYFPMDVDFFTDIKVRRIKKDCGPASISVLICLLCNIYRDGYYILLNEDLPFFIAETTGVTEGAVLEIINKAVQVGFFNKSMLDNHSILTSKGIQKRFLHAVKMSKLKRNGVHALHNLLEISEEAQESSEDIAISTEDNSEHAEESTQSKVKKRKESIAHFFESVWAQYPEKKGKARVSDTQKAKLYRIGSDQLTRCIDRYKQDKPDWKQWQNGSTFFNGGYVDYLDENYTKTQQESRWQSLD